MLNKNNSMLLIIDIQEKLVNMLKEKSEIAKTNFTKIIKAAKILNIPIVLTEQYPKGLGGTIEPVKEILKEDYKPFEKTTFSAIKEEEIYKTVKETGKKRIVLFGIEAHICVFQTALELKEKGFEVVVVHDLCYSRNNDEKELIMKNLRHGGILTLSLETILFMWLEGSKNPNFKEVQAIIK